MDQHIYNSFEEIDLHLEILKTEAQLERVHLKHQYHEARDQMSVFSIVGSLVSSLAKKAVIVKLINKFLK